MKKFKLKFVAIALFAFASVFVFNSCKDNSPAENPAEEPADEPADEEPAQITFPYLGTLPALGIVPHLQNVVNSQLSAHPDLKIAVFHSDASELNDAERQAVKELFDAGGVVVATDVGAKDAAGLKELLGEDWAVLPASGDYHYDFYALTAQNAHYFQPKLEVESTVEITYGKEEGEEEGGEAVDRSWEAFVAYAGEEAAAEGADPPTEEQLREAWQELTAENANGAGEETVTETVQPVYTYNDLSDVIAPFATWLDNFVLNRDNNPALTADPTDISVLMTAQTYTWNQTCYLTSKLKSGETFDKTITYTVNQYIWALHSINQHRDYYLIREEMVLPNGNVWQGHWSKYHFPYRWNMVAAWMADVGLNHWITDGYHRELTYDKASVQQTSPQTANNVTTVTSGLSLSLTGTVAFKPAGGPSASVSGNLTYKEEKSYTILDVAVTNQSSSNGPNAYWQYVTQKVPKPNAISSNFSEPATLAVSTAQFFHYWFWTVDNPGANDQFWITSNIYPVWELRQANSLYGGGYAYIRLHLNRNFEYGIIPPPRTAPAQ
ncbi:MAG: hypothetical protein LBJ01_12310 [Tannerella sp.]|jgi:hypothetical protein|nr:hypothetical protein [Tannerella sp.]